MIVETGRVAKIEAGKTFVEIEKGTDCVKCHVGCVCDFGKKVVLVEAEDPVGVQKNQMVQLSVSEDSSLRAAVVVYGIPLLAIIIGVLVGEYLGEKFGSATLFEILGVFGGLGLSLLVIKQYDKKFKQNRNRQPVIMKIIE
jgi:sigma-E factor negative regulatory protein RseC